MARSKGKELDYSDRAVYTDVGQVKGTGGRQASALGWGWRKQLAPWA